MIEKLYLILACMILVCSLIYVWHKLLNKKINFTDYKLYISLVSITAISYFNFYIVDKFIRVILITIVFMFFFRYLFKENLQKCIITPIFYQLLIILSETIFALLTVTIFKLNLDKLVNEYVGTFLVNVVVSILSIILVNIPFIKKLYNNIILYLDKIKREILIILSLSLVCIFNIVEVITYYKIDVIVLVIINVIFMSYCFFIIIYLFKTQSNYNKVSSKYNLATKSLNDYEEMMTKYRVANHENKNLLKTIRAMILNNEKDIPKYIDTIVEEKYEVDDKLLFKMSVIPTGGLRATIYSEILKIKENKIDYNLNIDRKIRTIDFIEMDTNVILDICKIVSVFIDNAIEEVKNIDNKYIGIDLYMEENKLFIKISNCYGNKINIDKIFDEGYTTKGSGHGYGLPLVKEIIKKNSIFENRLEITDEIFSQILIVKIKKGVSRN